MINEKAADVINIIRERIDGELLCVNDNFYVWYISGEKVPKKVLSLCFHSGSGCPYWTVMTDGSELNYVQKCVAHPSPYSMRTVEDVVEEILAAWQ